MDGLSLPRNILHTLLYCLTTILVAQPVMAQVVAAIGQLNPRYDAIKIRLPEAVEFELSSIDINNHGEMIGATDQEQCRSFVYNRSGNWHEIVAPLSHPGFSVWADTINDSGTVAGVLSNGRSGDSHTQEQPFLYSNGKFTMIPVHTPYAWWLVIGIDSLGNVLLAAKEKCYIYKNGRVEEIFPFQYQKPISCTSLSEDGSITGTAISDGERSGFALSGFVFNPSEKANVKVLPFYPISKNKNQKLLVAIPGSFETEYGTHTPDSGEIVRLKPPAGAFEPTIDALDINNQDSTLGNVFVDIGDANGVIPVEAIIFDDQGNGEVLRKLVAPGPLHQYRSVHALRMSQNGKYILVSADNADENESIPNDAFLLRAR